jgi:uncharacterized membrane protein
MCPPLPTVHRFLFCLSLKAGGIIIGTISLLWSIATFLFSSLILVLAVALATGALGEDVRQQAKHGVEEMIRDQWITDEHGEVLCAVLFLTLVMVVLAVVLSSFHLVACALLIHGARVSRPGFLTPWIVITVVVLVVNFLQTLRVFAMNNVNLGLIHVVSLLLSSYFLICIHSLQKKIEENRAKPRKYPGNVITFNKV